MEQQDRVGLVSAAAVERSGKAQAVFEVLKREILTGVLGPNERLVQQDLVNRFGVSKTPVREALSMLKHEGLVRGQYYRGMSVISISRRSLRELFEVREVLEGIAARGAALRSDGTILDLLADNIRAQEMSVEKDAFYTLNAEFHGLIAANCGNNELRRVVASLYDQNRILTISTLNPLLNTRKPRSALVLAEHSALASAISIGDGERAEQLGRQHVRNAFARLVGGTIGGDVEGDESGAPLFPVDHHRANFDTTLGRREDD